MTATGVGVVGSRRSSSTLHHAWQPSEPAQNVRRLLSTLREVFGVRLYEAIGDGGPMTLFIGGDQLYARTNDGRLFNLEQPTQPLLMVGESISMRPLAARERRRRTSGSEKLSRRLDPAAA